MNSEIHTFINLSNEQGLAVQGWDALVQGLPMERRIQSAEVRIVAIVDRDGAARINLVVADPGEVGSAVISSHYPDALFRLNADLLQLVMAKFDEKYLSGEKYFFFAREFGLMGIEADSEVGAYEKAVAAKLGHACDGAVCLPMSMIKHIAENAKRIVAGNAALADVDLRSTSLFERVAAK